MDADGVSIAGTIRCEGGIRVEVEERLRAVSSRPLFHRRGAKLPVELVFYRYNAVLGNRGPIFRYNSPHADHRPYHHVHRVDVFGTGAETVTPLRRSEVPSVRTVLNEAEQWYWDHLRREDVGAGG
jgi:hypothetical protein